MTFTKISGEIGFNGVEFRIDKIKECFKKEKLKNLAKVLNLYRIDAIGLNAIEDFSLSPENIFEKLLSEIRFLCKICNRINCRMLIAVPSFYQTRAYTKKFIFQETSHQLRQLSDLTIKFDLKVGFEFLGFPYCSIRNLEDAWKIVETLDIKNLGLVIDTFHFYLSESKIETLLKIPLEKIFLIHVNDAPAMAKRKLMDKHRILPFDGIIPLSDIFNTFIKKGYRGYVSIELFNEKYWKENPKLVAKKAFDSLCYLKSMLSRSIGQHF